MKQSLMNVVGNIHLTVKNLLGGGKFSCVKQLQIVKFLQIFLNNTGKIQICSWYNCEL